MWSQTAHAISVQSLKALDCIDGLFHSMNSVTGQVHVLALDFTSIDFVTPVGGIALTLAARVLATRAGFIQLTNVRPQIASYLHRVDFPQVVGGRLFLPPLEEEYKRVPASSSVVELKPIPSDPVQHKPFREAAQARLLTVLKSWYPETEAHQLATVICELLKNITHSRDVGHIAVQKYWNPRLNMTEVCIAVGDLGRGIRETLWEAQQIPPWTKDSAAIERALEVNVSCGNGGIGLSRVDQLIYEWNGVLSMRSGTGRVTIQGGQRACEDGLLFIPGVQIGITVRG